MNHNVDKKSESQVEKFRRTARELETDDDEKRFDERLRQVTKAPKPKSDTTPSGDDEST